MKPVAAFVTLSDERAVAETLPTIRRCPIIGDVAVGVTDSVESRPPDCALIRLPSLWSASCVQAILRWLEGTAAEHLLWVFSGAPVLDLCGIERLWHCARDTDATLAYGDYALLCADGATRGHPLLDYQIGSLRDDFDFGAVVLLSRARLHHLAASLDPDTRHGGWYDLRLRLAEAGAFVHLPEPIYRLPEADLRSSGDKVFDYVDPSKRDYQVEMERVATAYLERIGAWLEPPTAGLLEDSAIYPVTASIVIPVRDRAKTIGDAVGSALGQQAPFDFNVIVVDNHSADGTTEVLSQLAAKDARLVHVIPDRADLGIGGCWNEAIDSPQCGRYVTQLDSDDIYAGTGVLARMVGELESAPYAAVIGSYETVSFTLEPRPPGLIDHSEWTDTNGHNNALRVAGFGAPRAFHVPTLRSIGFPNVSYGEDYAVMLRLSRTYRIGRIYESLYLCRRWEGNTDSALSLEVCNRYAAYKDRLRSIEIAGRQRQNGVR